MEWYTKFCPGNLWDEYSTYVPDVQSRKTKDEPILKKIPRLLWEKQHCADVYKRDINWISHI